MNSVRVSRVSELAENSLLSAVNIIFLCLPLIKPGHTPAVCVTALPLCIGQQRPQKMISASLVKLSSIFLHLYFIFQNPVF